MFREGDSWAVGLKAALRWGWAPTVRLESWLTTGFALVHEGQILHLSAFNSWKF